MSQRNIDDPHQQDYEDQWDGKIDMSGGVSPLERQSESEERRLLREALERLPESDTAGWQLCGRIRALLARQDNAAEPRTYIDPSTGAVEEHGQAAAPSSPGDKLERVEEVLRHLDMLCNYAYKMGFHELGYDPVLTVRAWLSLQSATPQSDTAKPARPVIPHELYDGSAVYVECSADGRASDVRPRHVSEVLDAVVRLIRRRPTDSTSKREGKDG